MKSNKEPIEDLRLIRKMMEESSRFLSLSGLSGVSAGIVAIAGALVLHYAILTNLENIDGNMYYAISDSFVRLRWMVALVAGATLALALFFAWYFTWRKSRKTHSTFWTASAKKMVASLASILAVGGALSIILAINDAVKLIPGVTLLFYGMSILFASRYTHRDIVVLGWLQVGLGLLAALLPSIGLLFWTIGFGLLHIIYGVIMYIKYDRTSR